MVLDHLKSFNSASASSKPRFPFPSPASLCRSGEMLLCLLQITDSPVQFSQTNVAVRDERAHAEFFSEGESLAIVVFRLSRYQGDLRAPRSRRGAEECTPRVLSLCADGRDPGRAVRRHGHPLPDRPADTLRSARWSAAIGPHCFRMTGRSTASSRRGIASALRPESA